MGPARNLHKVFSSDAIRNFRRANGKYDDQGALALYMLDHPSQVTIDHGMLLVASLNHFANTSFFDVGNNHFHNFPTQGMYCFIHGSGIHGKVLLSWLELCIAVRQHKWANLLKHFQVLVQASILYFMQPKFLFEHVIQIVLCLATIVVLVVLRWQCMQK
eukprot:gnl/MRDRNA2_/MRDRNA2_161011_c0_seq1.p1 gnl/MRDRNA2_/MRDRNA2_161011_c0~~gnl/MRDRNA2_/MRDRNA2_161011_c0_seq1.p1  ORF type:complete len:182 (+),score=13.62 gnl/MRDRNA2_/MRDRNA2_161011_c0_seq1:68-547(+)